MNAIAPIQSMPVEGNLITSLQRAEIDQQISTARAYPRSVERAVVNIATLATLDEETAQECMYVLPRGGKKIEGPSARLAEIISSQWGNCRVAARVVHVDKIEKYIEAEGVFHDLETNTAQTARVRRRISDSNGKLYNEDMIIVTGNAACSIAKRNAVLSGVPKGVWRRAYERAQEVIKGNASTLVAARDKTLEAFVALGISNEAVFKSIGVVGTRDITLNHIGTLRGMYATLKNGEATAEEMFGEGKVARKPAPDIPDIEEQPTQEAKAEAKQAAAKTEATAQVAQSPAATAAQSQPAPVEKKHTTAPVGDMFPGDRSLANTAADEEIAKLDAELRNCEDYDELEKLRATWAPRIKKLPNNTAARANKLISDAIFAAT